MYEMENNFASRNTSTMFVQARISDDRSCNTGSYTDGRNEAGISNYPAVPYLLGNGILYRPNR
jgi:hypothetical protein